MTFNHIRISLYTFILCGFVHKMLRLRRLTLGTELSKFISICDSMPPGIKLSLMETSGIVTYDSTTGKPRYHVGDINALRRFIEISRDPSRLKEIRDELIKAGMKNLE